MKIVRKRLIISVTKELAMTSKNKGNMELSEYLLKTANSYENGSSWCDLADGMPLRYAKKIGFQIHPAWCETVDGRFMRFIKPLIKF